MNNKAEIKINKAGVLSVISIFLLVFFLSVVSSQQYYNPTFQNFYEGRGIDYSQFWPALGNSDVCEATQDFILNIRPGGCTPAVVRSDLLEEQNVPVFCQVDAVKLNPLIDVAEIKSVQFSGQTSDDVAGIAFHPANAALKIYDKTVGSPVLSNIGYVVIILKRNPKEEDMPDFVKGNLTARIYYDMKNAFGTGRAEIYVPVLNDEEWKEDFRSYGFWKGKGYVRLDDIEGDKARITIYNDKDSQLRTLSLKKGETSDLLYMPGFYCKAGVRFRLNSLNNPEIKVKLQVDENELWLVKGQRFLDDRCSVKRIDSLAEGGRVQIKCPGKTLDLSLGVSEYVNFEYHGEIKQVKVGEALNPEEKNKDNRIYVAYSGIAPKYVFADNPNMQDFERRFVVLIKGSQINDDKFDENRKNINEKTLNEIKSSLGAVSLLKIKVAIEEFFGKDTKLSYFQSVIASVNDILKERTLLSGGNMLDLLRSVFSRPTDYKQTTTIAWFGKDDKKIGHPEVAGIGQGRQLSELPGFGYKFTGTGEPIDIDYNDDRFNEGNQDGKKLEEYYENAKETADELVDLFGNEKINEEVKNSEYYGQRALDKAIELSILVKKQKTAKELIEKYIEKYPEASDIELMKQKLDSLSKYDFKDAGDFVDIDYEPHFIRIIEIKEPGFYDKGVLFSVNGEEKRIMEDERVYFDLNNTEEDYFDLTEFDEGKVEIRYYYEDDRGVLVNDDYEIEEGSSRVLGRSIVKVQEIFLKKEASVSVLPEIQDKYTEADFGYQIGIEKRAIQLTPERTLEIIKNLNKTITDLEEIVDNLGNVIKGMKAACFGTSVVLLVKNFLDNLSGRGMAREIVMRSPGGWNDKCRELISNKEYSDMDECFANSEIAKQVDEGVEEMAKQIEKTNKEIEEIQKRAGISKSDSLLGTTIDSQKAGEVYMNEIFFKEVDKKTIEELGGEEKIKEMYKSGYLSWQDMRDIVTYGRMREGVNKEISSKKLGLLISPLEARAKELEAVSRFSELGGENTEVLYPSEASKSVTTAIYDKTYNENVKGEFVPIHLPAVMTLFVAGEDKTTVEQKNLAGEYILLKVNYSKELGLYEPVKDEAWLKSKDGEDGVGNKLSNTEFKALTEYLSSKGIDNFRKRTPEDCLNEYKNPEVRYFEKEPSKGLPAVVPVDIQKGWYAGTKQVLPGFGIEPYEQSGRVVSLWLCNVGQDGIESFESSSSDDTPCIQINLNTGQPLDQISCLSEAEARRLVDKAVSVIRQASEQYGKGKKVRLSGIGEFDVGKAAGFGLGTQCQDFMSPDDCKILFNVCDPVICPSSRCDLGGAYPVDDVIQSGVIGSVALCLPNYKEGIAVPVCLSGIQAGLDSYTSILKAYRDCLQYSLDTGEKVGICDEIHSIYLCDFFWRQFSPLLRLAVPKIIETLYYGGQGARGGGEYLSVTNAWDNVQNSISYFSNYYASNSVKAFKTRSTEEVGIDVCKVFISANYPNEGVLDTLLEPDSPTQFYARFDEVLFSDATVPSTSQYKVFYHIYAGNDQGVYYSVYLKTPLTTSYYQSQPIVVVDTGYIRKGEYADKTKDFTAPTGYQNLCVRINTKEECGFKEVSTSYAVNYLADKYKQEQASQEISNEKDCVSGTPSLYPAISPNIQGGLEEAALPEIYARGIIRVCSSDNPGKSTNPERWEKVGNCEQDKGIGCWLDKESVKNTIRDKNIENFTLEAAQKILMEDEVSILGDKETQARLGELETDKESIIIQINAITDKNSILGFVESDSYKETIKNLQDVIDRGYLNNYKARAMLQIYEIYDALTKKFYAVSGVKKIIQRKLGEVGVPGAEEEAGKEGEKEIKGIEGVAHFVLPDGINDDVFVRWNPDPDSGENGKVEVHIRPNGKTYGYDETEFEWTSNPDNLIEGTFSKFEIDIENDMYERDLSVIKFLLGASSPSELADYMFEAITKTTGGMYLYNNVVDKKYDKNSNEEEIRDYIDKILGTNLKKGTDVIGGGEKKVSDYVMLRFGSGIISSVDSVAVRWSYDSGKVEVHIRPNIGIFSTPSHYNPGKKDRWTSDPKNLASGTYGSYSNDKQLEDDIYPEDLNKIRQLLERADSPKNLRLSIFSIVNSERAYVYNYHIDKKYKETNQEELQEYIRELIPD